MDVGMATHLSRSRRTRWIEVPVSVRPRYYLRGRGITLQADGGSGVRLPVDSGLDGSNSFAL